MLVIWGWRAVSRTLGTGVFYCPGEDADLAYRHRKARRWFTLFFIPVIPLNELGEYVECEGCDRRYDQGVLTMPTAAQMTDDLANAMRYAIVALGRTDGIAGESQRTAALEAMRKFGDTPYLEADLSRDLMELDASGFEPAVSRIAGSLSESGKERFIAECVRLGAADGGIDESAVERIKGAAAALEMSPLHLAGILVSLAGYRDEVDPVV